jgi:hypothetical protein
VAWSVDNAQHEAQEQMPQFREQTAQDGTAVAGIPYEYMSFTIAQVIE